MAAGPPTFALWPGFGNLLIKDRGSNMSADFFQQLRWVRGTHNTTTAKDIITAPGPGWRIVARIVIFDTGTANDAWLAGATSGIMYPRSWLPADGNRDRIGYMAFAENEKVQVDLSGNNIVDYAVGYQIEKVSPTASTQPTGGVAA